MDSDAVTPALAPKQIRSRKTREQILSAAEAVVVRDGVAGLTMLAVAEESGVSIGGIYRRFANKHELLHAVKDLINSHFEQSVQMELAGGPKGVEDVVRAFTFSLAEAFQRRGEGFRMLLREGQNDPEIAVRGKLGLFRTSGMLMDALSDFIPGASDRLEVRMVVELVNGALIRRATMGDENSMLSWDDFAEQLVQIAAARLTSIM